MRRKGVAVGKVIKKAIKEDKCVGFWYLTSCFVLSACSFKQIFSRGVRAHFIKKLRDQMRAWLRGRDGGVCLREGERGKGRGRVEGGSGRELVDKWESSSGSATASYCQAKEGVQHTLTHSYSSEGPNQLFPGASPADWAVLWMFWTLHMEASGVSCAPGFIL